MAARHLLILTFLCVALLIRIAPDAASGEEHTYLIKLKNGAEIICEQISLDGDTLYYDFGSHGHKNVGINKSAVKAIFVGSQDNEDNLTFRSKNILPRVLDPSHGPWQ
jgi:hypothetical protein